MDKKQYSHPLKYCPLALDPVIPMDFDSSRVFYSDQSLLAPPPDYSSDLSSDDEDEQQVEEGMDESDLQALLEARQKKEEAKRKKQEEKARKRREALLAGKEGKDYDLGAVARHFKEFIRSYHLNGKHIYRTSLVSSARLGRPKLAVSLSHLNEYDPTLYSLVLNSPGAVMPVFEKAAMEALRSMTLASTEQEQEQGGEGSQEESDRSVHVTLTASHMASVDLRQITSSHVNKLIKTPGIVISTTRIRSKARLVTAMCKDCGKVRKLTINDPYGTAKLPSRCDGGEEDRDCSHHPYLAMPDKCLYVDTQSLKLQESPEQVPTGEMPRNILLAVERGMVEKVKPGMRISVIGVASLYKNGKRGRPCQEVLSSPFSLSHLTLRT